MKLDKAIEILELNIKVAGAKMPTDTLEALKLATKALHRCKAYREAHVGLPYQSMPGED